MHVRQKISIAMKGNQYAKGFKHSDETRAKISKSSSGRKYPNRKPWPAESNLKRSIALKGRPKSEEWKQKLRLAAIKRWGNIEERKKQAERTKASWGKR